MADVYEAEDTLLGRSVAVKLLHANFASDDAFVARFRREAQAAANLSHPNIVAIYDWGQDEGTYFMVMEPDPRPNVAARSSRPKAPYCREGRPRSLQKPPQLCRSPTSTESITATSSRAIS